MCVRKWIEPPLVARGKRAFELIPENTTSLLEVGCAYGYHAKHFQIKVEEYHGIDYSAEFVELARERYPALDFREGVVEELPFDDEVFDVVVMLETLEHVTDEVRAIEEVYRVLKPGGIFILSVPHKGLLAFADIENLRYNFPRFHALLRKIARVAKNRNGDATKPPTYSKQDRFHKHYSVEEIRHLLAGKFRIQQVYRSALFHPFFHYVDELLRRLFRKEQLPFKSILHALGDLDYSLRMGSLSYDVMFYAVKEERSL